MDGNPDPKPGRWILPLVILGMVGVTYVVVNSIEPASPAQADSAGTDTTSGPATTTTTLDERIVAYLDGLDAVDTEAQAMLEEATAINQRWDDDEQEFDTTLAQLQDLVERAEAFRDSVQTQTPPSGFSELAEAHTILIEIADRVVTGAEAMVAGLRAPDTGEQRRAALDDFGVVIGEFDTQVDTLRELAGAAPAPEDGEGEDGQEGEDGEGEEDGGDDA